MSQSWIEQLEKGWGLLRMNSADLEVERFYRSALTAFRSKAVDAPGLAVIANRMLESPLEGAPYLGRKMLEQAGTRAFPVIGFVYALSLLHGRGGPSNFQLAHQELEHLTYNEDTPRDIKGLSFSALADSYRTGRGVDADTKRAKTLYQQAAELGYVGAARNLGLYYENLWEESVSDESLPNLNEAARYYRMGASKDTQCASRFEQVRERRKN